MTPDEFRRHGHAVVDWIADYHSRIESFPVLSQVKPGQIRASLPPVLDDKNFSGSPSMHTSQSRTWVSSSVQAGLVDHSMPCTPRPEESRSPRIPGPDALHGK